MQRGLPGCSLQQVALRHGFGELGRWGPEILGFQRCQDFPLVKRVKNSTVGLEKGQKNIGEKVICVSIQIVVLIFRISGFRNSDEHSRIAHIPCLATI